MLLALCAAAWFSGGTRQDWLRGLAAVAAWVVARACARHLEMFTAHRAGRRRARRQQSGQASLARGDWPDRTDWLVLAGFGRNEPPAGEAHRQPATVEAATLEPATVEAATAQAAVAEPTPAEAKVIARSDLPAGPLGFGWLYAVFTVAAQCAIYGGIAAGAQAVGWTGMWPLAITAVIAASVARVAGTCSETLRLGDQARAAGRQAGVVRSGLMALALPPAGVNVLLAALITVGYGPRIALFSVIVIETVSLGISGARMAARPAPRASADQAGPEFAADSAWREVLLTCRDDGPLARRAGWLVRGNLTPLPPVLAGLAAIGLLAALGLRNLPGLVAITPVVVLLLAAPGSSHPHDGRFDWLAPVLLCLGQYGYIAAFGLAHAVAGPVIFAACSMSALWYANLAVGDARAAPAQSGPAEPDASRPARARTVALTSRRARLGQAMTRRSAGLGWEGRVGLIGLAGIFGIATFGYLGLSAWLAALICRKAVNGYLM